MGSLEFFTELKRSFRLGLIAIPLSVIITSISSPGQTSVVTLSTITGILSIKEGIAKILLF